MIPPFKLDAGSLMVSILFSGAGFVYFSYGRKRSEMRFVIAGLALMAYGYFLDSLIWTAAIGLALCAAPFLLG